MSDSGSTKPRVIALYSPAPQAGKTTLAGFLEGMGYHRASFAEPIKHIVGQLLRSVGVGMEEINDRLYGDLKEAAVAEFNGLSTRQVVKIIGTECVRDMINEGLWTLIMRETIRRSLAAGISVVIDDLRFPNEYDMLRDEGATLVKVTSPRMLDQTGHRSDGALEGPGYGWHDNVTNDGTLEQLRFTATHLAGLWG